MVSDKQRVQKSLFTSHARGPTPLLRDFESATEEAGFIAREVRRVVASSGGMLGYADCAVLCELIPTILYFPAKLLILHFL